MKINKDILVLRRSDLMVKSSNKPIARIALTDFRVSLEQVFVKKIIVFYDSKAGICKILKNTMYEGDTYVLIDSAMVYLRHWPMSPKEAYY